MIEKRYMMGTTNPQFLRMFYRFQIMIFGYAFLLWCRSIPLIKLGLETFEM